MARRRGPVRRPADRHPFAGQGRKPRRRRLRDRLLHAELVHDPRRNGLLEPYGIRPPAGRRLQHHRQDVLVVERRAGTGANLDDHRRLHPARPQRQRLAGRADV